MKSETTMDDFLAKVEELVKVAEACVPIAQTGAGLGPVEAARFDQAQVKRLTEAIREVKTALKLDKLAMELAELVLTWSSVISGGAHGSWEEIVNKALELKAALK